MPDPSYPEYPAATPISADRPSPDRQTWAIPVSGSMKMCTHSERVAWKTTACSPRQAPKASTYRGTRPHPTRASNCRTHGAPTTQSRPLCRTAPGTLDARAALRGGGDLVHSIVQDLKFAIRSLVAIPVTSLAIIVTLTLGIGMNSAIFGVVDTVLLQPLDYAQPDELVYLRARAPAAERDNLSFSGGMVNRLRESPRQLQRNRGGGDPATEPDRRCCPGAGADGEPAEQGRRLEGTRLPVGEW